MRRVLTADVSGLLAGAGIYLLISLVTRLVQTPGSSGYGLRASIAVAGLVLLPFSVGSFVAAQVAVLIRRVSLGVVLPIGSVVVLFSMLMFAYEREPVVGRHHQGCCRSRCRLLLRGAPGFDREFGARERDRQRELQPGDPLRRFRRRQRLTRCRGARSPHGTGSSAAWGEWLHGSPGSPAAGPGPSPTRRAWCSPGCEPGPLGRPPRARQWTRARRWTRARQWRQPCGRPALQRHHHQQT
jgi:hypothetical protein